MRVKRSYNAHSGRRLRAVKPYVQTTGEERQQDKLVRYDDTGRYQSGYRVYRDGSYREDFGSDR